jgi:hypothetical protein
MPPLLASDDTYCTYSVAWHGMAQVGSGFDGTLEKVTELPRSLGFQGKLCIHPSQVAIVNGVFGTLTTGHSLCALVSSIPWRYYMICA